MSTDPLRFTAFLALLKEAGLPLPVTEYKFHTERRWRFDFCWVSHKVAVECEGGVWAYGRHNRPAGYLKDCEKYSAAAELGWRVLRYPTQKLASRETIEQIKRTLNT